MWRYGKKNVDSMSVDEHRPLAVKRAQVDAQEADIGGVGHAIQVGGQRLLVVQVDDDVADHARMLAHRRAGVTGPKVPPDR